MEPDSIFSHYSIDRHVIHWEDYLYDLTPIEQIGSLNFKREDYFAPLGYGGINGAKLRQAIWLALGTEMKEKSTILSGTSLESPQLPMGCFTSNTEILLATGETISFKEMVASDKQEFEVRTLDLEKQRFISSIATHPRVIKEVTELVELELEDESLVYCTKEHLFLTKNRGWVQAQFLESEDEMENFYD